MENKDKVSHKKGYPCFPFCGLKKFLYSSPQNVSHQFGLEKEADTETLTIRSCKLNPSYIFMMTLIMMFIKEKRRKLCILPSKFCKRQTLCIKLDKIC